MRLISPRPMLRSRLLLGALPAALACQDQGVLAFSAPPAVSIIEPSDGSSFYEGLDVNFRVLVEAQGEDDPTEMTHMWVSGNQTMCDPGELNADGTGDCSFAFDDTGEHTVTVTVTTADRERATATIGIIIKDNSAPDISILAPDDGEYFAVDELIRFEAYVSDPEEDAEDLTVELFSSVTGDLGAYAQPTSSGAYETGVYMDSGTHLVTARVTDASGKTDQDTVTLTVYDHGPPSIDAVSITPSPAVTLDDLVANPQGWVDLDDADEKYRYRWFIGEGGADLEEDLGEGTGTYPYGKTKKGDLLQVEVTPYNEYGDGEAMLSPAIEIANSPPTAPSIAIGPSSPEPDDDLVCTVIASSGDDDGDTVSYLYAWYQNGSLTGHTGNLVEDVYTAHGDTWECVCEAWDGEDRSASVSDTVAVSDGTAPDAPTIDSPYQYRNDEEVTLSGECEAGCSLTLYCADALSSWTDTETCDSAGEFEYTTALTRGQTTTCYADCEDAAGNVSGYSNSVSTEVCDPYDEYEDNAGYGDAGSNPVDEWSTLSDAGTSTISIESNILAGDTVDWYVVSTSDSVTADRSAGIDYYNMHVEMVAGTGTYGMLVYKGGADPTDQECSTSASYTEYNDFVEDVGDGSHTIPSDSRYCGNGSVAYNNCEDMSDDYYIQVFRKSSTVSSCQHFELEITNGVW